MLCQDNFSKLGNASEETVEKLSHEKSGMNTKIKLGVELARVSEKNKIEIKYRDYSNMGIDFLIHNSSSYIIGHICLEIYRRSYIKFGVVSSFNRDERDLRDYNN